MQRFERLWTQWQERVARGESPAAFLPTLPDEDVVGLLAGAPDTCTTGLTRNLLATEAMNRLRRAHRAIVTVATDLSEELLRLHAEVVEGVLAAREDEAWLPEAGRREREAARELAIAHAQATGAIEALDQIARRAGAFKLEVLAHTRDPEQYVTP
ncbi:MAG: hypothetical protein QOE90_1336 [Thermoplasmata archaeon]|jgi:hypothetical protein|nr:hypothetical protein [Thermoplasmata archaeon]